MSRFTHLCLIGLIAATAGTAFCTHVFGANVFRDDFNRPDGRLLGTTPDVGGTWTQNGTNATNPIQISSGSVLIAFAGQDVYGALSSPVATEAGNALKTSLDLNVSGAQAGGDFFLHFTDPLGTTATTNYLQRLRVRSVSTEAYQLGFQDATGTGSSTTWGTETLRFDTSYHVDAVWYFVAGERNDVFSVTVDDVRYLGHRWSSQIPEPAQLSGINLRQGDSASAPLLALDNLVVNTLPGVTPLFSIFQWEYINPADPSQGKQQSTTLCPDGAGVEAVPAPGLTGRDLTKAYLSGKDLNGAFAYQANLTNADLSSANLRNFNASNANLTNADLSHADLSNATLTDADLSQANLTNVEFGFVSLAGANLSQANLANAELYYANLTGANFSHANLTGANLYEASLTRANLSHANLTGADLIGTDLTGANLSEADLTDANIHAAELSSTQITPDQLYSTVNYRNLHNLSGIQFVGNDLSGANFAGQTLVSTSFYAAKLVGADFTNADLTYAELVNADLSGANLTGADFTDATLALANLRGADLTNAYLGGTNLIGTNLTGADIRGANLSRIITVGGYDPGGSPKFLCCLKYYYPETQTTIAGTGITLAQLVSTASYGAHDLSDATLMNNNFNGGSFAGFNLTNANFYGTTLVGADLSGADARGSVALEGFAAPNVIRFDGHINGLDLDAGGLLIVRDYEDPRYTPLRVIPIIVDQHLTLSPGGTLRMVFEADAWDSTISFALGIPATLGGSLELAFAADVNLTSQIGRTFDVFNWNGVSPTGTFNIASPYLWNLSNLYTTGEISLLDANGTPEPSGLFLLSVALVAAWMTRRTRPIDTFATPLASAGLFSTILALLVIPCDQSLAVPPEIQLAKIGAPVWKPVDFQLFSAPATPFDAEFGQVYGTLLPYDTPLATTYVPHEPPYDTELSDGMIAGGYVSQSVFNPKAITLDPNGMYFAYMLVPDPGIAGSSRDFAAGPVIPNSLFPLAANYDVWLDGVLVDRAPGADAITPVQPRDVGHDATSHLESLQVFWHPWDDDLTVGPVGNYELRLSIRDVGGSGWDVVTPFQVVPELPGDFNGNFTVDAADYVVWRKNPGGIYTQDDYNTWRANFSQTFSFTGSGSSLRTPDPPSPAVPEPASLILLEFALGAAGFVRIRKR